MKRTRWFVISLILLCCSVILWAQSGDPRTSKSQGGDATTIGQLVILFTFLVNSGIQIWRERNARKDREQERQDALAREQRIKDTVTESKDEVKAAMTRRVAEVHKRLDELAPGESDDHATQR